MKPIKIKATKEILDMFKNLGIEIVTEDDNEYYHFPYWMKEDGDNILIYSYHDSVFPKDLAKWMEQDFRAAFPREPIPFPGRRVGNTTRLADYYIQEFFVTGKISIKDNPATIDANKNIARIIFNRLENEHGITSQHLEIERGPNHYYTIKIKKRE